MGLSEVKESVCMVEVMVWVEASLVEVKEAI